MHNRNSFPGQDEERLLPTDLENLGQQADEEDKTTVSDVDEELGFVVGIWQLVFPLLFLIFLGITLMYLLFVFL